MTARWFALGCLVAMQASAGLICDARLDAGGNVIIQDAAGNKTQLTEDGGNLEPQLAADGMAVAWRRSFETIDLEDDHGELSALHLYDGRFRIFHCEPVLRDFWFVGDGTQIGLDCGGLHFAGIEQLIDRAHLTVLAIIDQSITPSGERPSWADAASASRAPATCPSVKTLN